MSTTTACRDVIKGLLVAAIIVRVTLVGLTGPFDGRRVSADPNTFGALGASGRAATPVGGSQQTHNPCDRLEAACCAVKNTYNK